MSVPPPPQTIAYIERAAETLGWPVDIIDDESHYLIRLSVGGRNVYFGGGAVSAFPLNAASAHDLARDKYHTFQVLHADGFRVPETAAFFLSDRGRDLRPAGRERADASAYAAGRVPVIVKPNTGSQGSHVYFAQRQDEVETALSAIAEDFAIALLQSPIAGDEYRVFVLDGEPIYAYRKAQACLIGDGTRSMRELQRAYNEAMRRQGIYGEINDHLVRLGLRQAGLGLDLEAPLPAQVRVPLPTRNNLSSGGGIEEIQDRFDTTTRAFCAQVARSCGLRACAVDVMCAQGVDLPDGTVLEVNSNPAMTGLERAGRGDLVACVWTRILSALAEDAQ